MVPSRYGLEFHHSRRAKYGCNKQTTLSPELKAMCLDGLGFLAPLVLKAAGMRTILPGTDKEGRAMLLLTAKHGKVLHLCIERVSTAFFLAWARC